MNYNMNYNKLPMIISNSNIDELFNYFASHETAQSLETGKKHTKRYQSSLIMFEYLKAKRNNIVNVHKKKILMTGPLPNVTDPVSFAYKSSQLEIFRSNWHPSSGNYAQILCRKAYISLFSTGYAIYDNAEMVSYIDKIDEKGYDVWNINPDCPNLASFKLVTSREIHSLLQHIGNAEKPEWLQNYLILQ